MINSIKSSIKLLFCSSISSDKSESGKEGRLLEELSLSSLSSSGLTGSLPVEGGFSPGSPQYLQEPFTKSWLPFSTVSKVSSPIAPQVQL